MKNESKVRAWLKENTDLAWVRTGGDTPAVKLDRLYINRSEGYEVRDFMLGYYECCNLEHNDKNYKNSFTKITKFRKGEKVKRVDMLNHLKKSFDSCCE